MTGYLRTGKKRECYGCGACVARCPFGAIEMQEDDEGFRYPVVDKDACRNCGLCHNVCPAEREAPVSLDTPYAYGCSHKDPDVLQESTSGGAFSALISAWFEREGDRVAWGAVAHGIDVCHECAQSEAEAQKFRKSKYSQSDTSLAFPEIVKQLKNGMEVLFSGTPCQVAALHVYLGSLSLDTSGLVTIEVVCEGVPSPIYIRKYADRLEKKHGAKVESLDYRDKDGARWDFEVMSAGFSDGGSWKIDRWMNPFWSIWLQHLMNRPSCYTCQFARPERTADISLGDLWGVHLYCPDLYNKNRGASLVICSTEAGKSLLDDAKKLLNGRQVPYDEARKYQGPLRQPIGEEPRRDAFMAELPRMDIDDLEQNWAKRPDARLLFSKYVWGNRQKVLLWRCMRRLRGRKGEE